MLPVDATTMAALRRLPTLQRAVYALRLLFGWDASDVAELLGWTVDCVDHALEETCLSIAGQANLRVGVDRDRR